MKDDNKKIEPVQTTTPEPSTELGSNRRKAWLTLVLFLALVIIASFIAFSGNSKPSKGSTSPKLASPTTEIAPAFVSITPSGYVPSTVSIKLGQAVEWTNIDSKVHIILSDNPSPSSSQPDLKQSQALSSNDSFTYIFSAKGSYSYHDTLNQSFHGTVIIK